MLWGFYSIDVLRTQSNIQNGAFKMRIGNGWKPVNSCRIKFHFRRWVVFWIHLCIAPKIGCSLSTQQDGDKIPGYVLTGLIES